MGPIYTIPGDHPSVGHLNLTPTYVLEIHGTEGKMLAGIKPDGSIQYGKNYLPDEAARVFWEAIGKGWVGFLNPIIEREIRRRMGAA